MLEEKRLEIFFNPRIYDILSGHNGNAQERQGNSSPSVLIEQILSFHATLIYFGLLFLTSRVKFIPFAVIYIVRFFPFLLSAFACFASFNKLSRQLDFYYGFLQL